MKVILAKNTGFCTGVKKAVDTAFSIYGSNVYILGEIIHNENVIEDINKLGTTTVDSIGQIPDNSKVIIRSHGVPENYYNLLKDKNCEIIDCTCPFVAKIHNIVKQYYSEGYKIIIIGKKDHPEVVGINGWCNNEALIIDNENDINLIDTNWKICVVSQTTFNKEKLECILSKINKINCNLVEIFKTICYTTQERQEEAKFLSKQLDCMIVVGGANSSNTQKLYNICKSNCSNTYFVNKSERLKNINLKHYKSVGIVSGASTPLSQSMEVFNFMEEKEVNSMEEAVALLDEKQNLKKGQKISVVISQVDEAGLKVYFDGKTDVSLPKEELISETFNKDDYEIGSEIEVIVVGKNPLRLSQKQIAINEKQDALLKELADGKIINVKIDSFNKGGLVSKYEGLNVFIPSREIKIGFVKELDKYVEKTLRVKVLKIDQKGKYKEIIASQRVLLEAEKEAREAEKAKKEAEFLANIAVNDIVTGKVLRFTNFGAFVNVNGFDCLAHISDLSWTNIKEPKEVLEINKSYDFVVLKVDAESKKVAIGYKQLQPKPWDLIPEKYAVGDVVDGTVVRILDFGAFVEIDKGVDGLVHVSQITHTFIQNPNEALKVGDQVKAKILAIDLEKEKITLSIKALEEAPAKPEKEEKDEEAKEPKAKKVKKAKKENKEDEEPTNWNESGSGVSIAELLNK